MAATCACVFTIGVVARKPAQSKPPARLERTLRGCLLPAVDGLVAEGHLGRLVSLVPFDMGVREKNVLPIVVRFPSYGRSPIGIAADTILRIIILVIVIGQEELPAINGVPGQHIRNREEDLPAIDRGA